MGEEEQKMGEEHSLIIAFEQVSRSGGGDLSKLQSGPRGRVFPLLLTCNQKWRRRSRAADEVGPTPRRLPPDDVRKAVLRNIGWPLSPEVPGQADHVKKKF